MKTLSITALCENDEIIRRGDELEDFWYPSLPDLFLAPTQNNLRNLSLRSPDLRVGYGRPQIGLEDIAFPHLTSLELEGLAFGDETPVEPFILRHGATLRRLTITDCLLACPEEQIEKQEDGDEDEAGTKTVQRWGHVFDRFRRELVCLQEIDVTEFGYGEFRLDTCYLRDLLKIDREQQRADTTALEKLESTVRQRRDVESS